MSEHRHVCKSDEDCIVETYASLYDMSVARYDELAALLGCLDEDSHELVVDRLRALKTSAEGIPSPDFPDVQEPWDERSKFLYRCALKSGMSEEGAGRYLAAVRREIERKGLDEYSGLSTDFRREDT